MSWLEAVARRFPTKNKSGRACPVVCRRQGPFVQLCLDLQLCENKINFNLIGLLTRKTHFRVPEKNFAVLLRRVQADWTRWQVDSRRFLYSSRWRAMRLWRLSATPGLSSPERSWSFKKWDWLKKTFCSLPETTKTYGFMVLICLLFGTSKKLPTAVPKGL